MRRIRVRVPGSTGNVGPGFDALGLALGIHNTLDVESSVPRKYRTDADAAEAVEHLSLVVHIDGEGADSLPVDGSNLVYRAMGRVLRRARLAPDSLSLVMTNTIPLARGLGSSAAAAVAGILAADQLCDAGLSQEDVLALATELDGHPDNAAASIWGGLTVSFATDAGPRAIRLPIRDRYACVVAVPGYQLATKRARRAIPKRLPREDAVFSLARAAALAGLLVAGETEGLDEATRDRIHQNRRAPLLPGFEDADRAARRAGALGVVLSGAGPSVMALVPKGDEKHARKVGKAMEKAYRDNDIDVRILPLRIDRRGATVSE